MSQNTGPITSAPILNLLCSHQKETDSKPETPKHRNNPNNQKLFRRLPSRKLSYPQDIQKAMAAAAAGAAGAGAVPPGAGGMSTPEEVGLGSRAKP